MKLALPALALGAALTMAAAGGSPPIAAQTAPAPGQPAVPHDQTPESLLRAGIENMLRALGLALQNMPQYEMPQINDDFASTDLAIVVGASDVVNPAAVNTTGTPISGMPILRADEARQVIVVNLDERPGYSGVPNQLYDSPRAILLWGDAKPTLRGLIDAYATALEPVV